MPITINNADANVEDGAAMTVLLLEDDDCDAKMVGVLLKRIGSPEFDVDWVQTVAEGVEHITKNTYDIALIDLNLPDATESEAVQIMKEASDTTPIIIMSGNEDEDLAVSLIEFGAQDYLVKGTFGTETLGRAIRYAIERKSTEVSLREQATSDLLTGLANRGELMHQLGRAMAHADRSGNMMACLLVDLDDFKQVNDTYGHAVGDALLVEVANRLEETLRDCDTASRLGGDEFAVVLESIESEEDLVNWLERTRELLTAPVSIENVSLRLSLSIGASLYPRDGAGIEHVLRSADLAMYEAKRLGKNQYKLYDQKLERTLHRRRRIESEIRSGLAANEFAPHYQPQMDLTTGRLVGLEALCRWRRTDKIYALPSEYITLIQDLDLITELGRSILVSVCRNIRSWNNTSLKLLPVSLKVDEQELRRTGYAQNFADTLRTFGVAPSRLRLEFPASVLLEKDSIIKSNLAELGAIGTTFAVDHLEIHPSAGLGFDTESVSILKLGRERTAALLNDKAAIAVTRALINLATDLGFIVIGEGVETARQFRALQQLGCQQIQGYFIARPLRPAHLLEWIERQTKAKNKARSMTGRFKLPPRFKELDRKSRGQIVDIRSGEKTTLN